MQQQQRRDGKMSFEVSQQKEDDGDAPAGYEIQEKNTWLHKNHMLIAVVVGARGGIVNCNQRDLFCCYLNLIPEIFENFD